MERHHRDVGALDGTALAGAAVANHFMGLRATWARTRYGLRDDR
jgi:hypothetical protein